MTQASIAGRCPAPVLRWMPAGSPFGVSPSIHVPPQPTPQSLHVLLLPCIYSFKRVSRDLEVCPTYTAGQVVHGMEYTTSDFIEDGTGSFGWTSCCLRVMCGQNATLTPISNKTHWIANLRLVFVEYLGL